MGLGRVLQPVVPQHFRHHGLPTASCFYMWVEMSLPPNNGLDQPPPSITQFRRMRESKGTRQNPRTYRSECAVWISNFIDRIRIIHEPVLPTAITAPVDHISYSTPSFLDSLCLSHFIHGNCAPQIDKVKTFPLSLLDWFHRFTLLDMTDLIPHKGGAPIKP